ncbi:MAG: diguanylate cyclase [Candidatus Obscuribacterales bacterium]
MQPAFLTAFKNDIASRTPGLLVYLNLADARRLNIHLGHQVVDRVIEAITRGLSESVGSGDASKRVAGDIWHPPRLSTSRSN